MMIPQETINAMVLSDVPLGGLTLNTLKVGIHAANMTYDTVDLSSVNLYQIAKQIDTVTDAYNGRLVYSEKQATSVAKSLIEMSTYANRNYFHIDEIFRHALTSRLNELKQVDLDDGVNRTLTEDNITAMIYFLRSYTLQDVDDSYNMTFNVIANNLQPIGQEKENVANYVQLMAQSGQRVGSIERFLGLLSNLSSSRALYSEMSRLDLDSPLSRTLWIPKLFNDDVASKILKLYGDATSAPQ